MHKLKVFMNIDALGQLEDEFIDEEDALRKFMFENVKVIARSAKMVTKTQKSFSANVIDKLKQKEDGGNPTKRETIKLKEFKLEKFSVKSDPDWIPKEADEDDITSYVLKVGDKTQAFLEKYCQIFNAKVHLYNKNLDHKVKGFNEERDVAQPAVCFEQIIHEQLIGPVMQKITASIDKEFDDEFEQVNNPDVKKREGRKGNKKSKK